MKNIFLLEDGDNLYSLLTYKTPDYVAVMQDEQIKLLDLKIFKSGKEIVEKRKGIIYLTKDSNILDYLEYIDPTHIVYINEKNNIMAINIQTCKIYNFSEDLILSAMAIEDLMK